MSQYSNCPFCGNEPSPGVISGEPSKFYVMCCEEFCSVRPRVYGFSIEEIHVNWEILVGGCKKAEGKFTNKSKPKLSVAQLPEDALTEIMQKCCEQIIAGTEDGETDKYLTGFLEIIKISSQSLQQNRL